MQEKRDRMLNKIQMLLQKTIDNGATQEEMNSAIEKATELMDKYNVSQMEIEKLNQKAEEIMMGSNKRKARNDMRDFYLWGLSNLTNCDVIINKSSGNYEYFGEETDIYLFEYLFNHIESFIEMSANDFKKTLYYQFLFKGEKLRANTDFKKSLAIAISKKIKEIMSNRIENTSSAYSIVLQNKLKKAQNALKEKYPTFSTQKTKIRYKDKYATEKGREAANNVNLQGGMNSYPASKRQIGN